MAEDATTCSGATHLAGTVRKFVLTESWQDTPIDWLRVPVLLEDFTRDPSVHMSSWHLLLPSDVKLGLLLRVPCG